MANAVIILGKSGTGKSSSIRGLDPKEAVILNVLGKKLPFKVCNIFIAVVIYLYGENHIDYG